MDDGRRVQMRATVQGYYDAQKLRIQCGLRMVAAYKVGLGQDPGTRETQIDSEGQKILKALRASYRRITDGIARQPRLADFDGDEIISDSALAALTVQYEDLVRTEANQERLITAMVKSHPMWPWFKEVRGIGPVFAAVLISTIRIDRADHASDVWAYAGYDVAPDGRGRGRYKEHLVDREYVSASGEAAVRKSITFNPFLKTKCRLIAESFVRQPAKLSEFRRVYDDYKHRIENSERHAEKTKGHRHAMAMRYVVKIFLLKMWMAWREVEGLPVTPSYHEGKLGHKHT